MLFTLLIFFWYVFASFLFIIYVKSWSFSVSENHNFEENYKIGDNKVQILRRMVSPGPLMHGLFGCKRAMRTRSWVSPKLPMWATNFDSSLSAQIAIHFYLARNMYLPRWLSCLMARLPNEESGVLFRREALFFE